MVSAVRIQVPRLIKALQIAEKQGALAAMSESRVKGVSTAGSRKASSSAAVAESYVPYVACVDGEG
jgi:hypothetical protein